MILQEGQEVYVGASVFRAGDEISDDLAREHGFDVDAINAKTKAEAETKAKEATLAAAPEPVAAPAKPSKPQPAPAPEN